MSTILVTGGAGFIGSHLCERLLSHGMKVIGLDNFDTFYDPKIKIKNAETIATRFPDLFDLVTGDIRNPEQVKEILQKNKVDVVIHLAARAGVRPSIAEPLLYQDVNIRGTIVLLEACKERGVENFIFASSSGVACVMLWPAFIANSRPSSSMSFHSFACFSNHSSFNLSMIC